MVFPGGHRERDTLGDIRVGTASWTDKTLVDCQRFYPEEAKSAEARLRFYATRFATVEVDSSYYGLPSARNAQLWAERTPEGFSFVVKAFRLFTLHHTAPEALPKGATWSSTSRRASPRAFPGWAK